MTVRFDQRTFANAVFAMAIMWWSACAAAMSFSDSFEDGTLSDRIPTGLDLPLDTWTSIAFQVTGTGSGTRLPLWVDGESMLDVFDNSGRPHNDGGHIALGASNHINRYMAYDNARRWSQPIPEPATTSLLALGLGALLLKLRCSRSSAGACRLPDQPGPGSA